MYFSYGKHNTATTKPNILLLAVVQCDGDVMMLTCCTVLNFFWQGYKLCPTQVVTGRENVIFAGTDAGRPGVMDGVAAICCARWQEVWNCTALRRKIQS